MGDVATWYQIVCGFIAFGALALLMWDNGRGDFLWYLLLIPVVIAALLLFLD